MPYSDIIVTAAPSEYLSFNNNHYVPSSKPTQKEYHFPVKIALSPTVKGMLDDINLVEQLIDQNYQFNRSIGKVQTSRVYP